MLWAALLLSPLSDPSSPSDDPRLPALATWALCFTPRVATVDEAVVMEVEASARLFGGRRALRDRVVLEGAELGVAQVAWAPNSVAALALARAGKENGVRRPIGELLDPLPMETVTAVRPHRTTLTQLGCRRLADLRSLPRGGISRRFDAALLHALDQAYGLRPEAHTWITVPETFSVRLELQARVEVAPALLFGARRLLMQLCGWLAARHAGITAFTLRWKHDSFRPRDVGDSGELTVRTAVPMRNLEHLCRLLAENLAKIRLLAPAGELQLEALDVQALEEQSASLLPDTAQSGESLTLVLERIAARLGPDKVLRPVVREDHRVEWMQHWQLAPAALPRKRPRRMRFPQPTNLLPEPLRLAMSGDRPLYQGPLHMLIGPHRVEGGWWDRVASKNEAGGVDQPSQVMRNVVRDYWVGLSQHSGPLLVFHERLSGEDKTAWYLQGSYS